MKKSFSLIEVVFAVGIIVLFLGSLIALFSVSSKNIVVSKHRLQAANLAREKIEMVRQKRDTNWLNPPTPWNASLPISDSINYPPPADNITYTRDVAYSTAGLTDTIKITVTVFWDDFGTEHNVTIVTYLTNWES